VGFDTDCGMQAEPLDVGAQLQARPVLARHRSSQGQYLVPGAGPESDPVGHSRGLQRPQRARLLAVGIRLGQLGLTHVLDQHAPAREQLDQPGDHCRVTRTRGRCPADSLCRHASCVHRRLDSCTTVRS
jgi:hypothetical protein